MCVCVCMCGPGSSVGIATDYGLDGPGSNPEIFRPSRPALGPTQPPYSAAVMGEYNYTSTHPLGHTGPVTASFYLIYIFVGLDNKLYKMHDTHIKIHQYMQYKVIRQHVSAYLSSHAQVLI